MADKLKYNIIKCIQTNFKILTLVSKYFDFEEVFGKNLITFWNKIFTRILTKLLENCIMELEFFKEIFFCRYKEASEF